MTPLSHHALTVIASTAVSEPGWAKHAIDQAEWFCTTAWAAVTLIVLLITSVLGVLAPLWLRHDAKKMIQTELARHIGTVREQINWSARGIVFEAAGDVKKRDADELERTLNSGPSAFGEGIYRQQHDSLYREAGSSFIYALRCFMLGNDLRGASLVKEKVAEAVGKLSRLRADVAEVDSQHINARAAAQERGEVLMRHLRELDAEFREVCRNCQSQLSPGDWKNFTAVAAELSQLFAEALR